MILSCNNISKSFGTDVIIKSCSFNIEDHEKAAIVGINGAAQGRTDMLNECLASRQQHELAALKKQMHSYSVEEYVTREMFTIAK